MPVEFLTDAQAGAYGRFAGLPSRMQLERFFFLDDGDLGLVGRRRGDHNRLGFAVQLATVRFVGTFLADPGGVPDEVVVYVAAQLDVAPASMATYTQREKTRLEHQWEIAREVGYRDFVDAEAELAVWIDDRAWTTGEGAVAGSKPAKRSSPGEVIARQSRPQRVYPPELGLWREQKTPANGDGVRCR